MARYLEQVQDQDETNRMQWDAEMQRPERQVWTDAAERELARIEGWDEFCGETPSEYLARTNAEAFDLEIPTLESIGL